MMKNTKDDRRSKRTRHLLGSALVELMLVKPYDTITVQDILNRANIGRSTFYAHYTDKEDLLISEIARVIHVLEVSELGNSPNGLLPSLEFFRHIKEQRRLMQAFVSGRGAEMLVRDFQKQMSKLVEKNLQTLMADAATFSVPLSVVGSFVASTFLMLLQWWFENDMRLSPEAIDAMFQKLVMPSIHTLMSNQ